MVDARRDAAEAQLLQPEHERLIRYAGNVVAGLCGVFGLFLLVVLSSPQNAQAGAQLISAPMAVQHNAELDLSDLTDSQPTISRTGLVTKSVNVLEVMEVLGADRQQAEAALASLESEGFLAKRNLKSGLELNVHLASGPSAETGRTLKALTLRTNSGKSVIAKRQTSGSYFSAELSPRLSLSYRRVAGTVSKSLSADMQAAGAEKKQVSKFLSVFAYNPKVPRALSKGDEFEMIYEAWEDERGEMIKRGDLVYASLEGGSITRGFYRYTPHDNGVTDFFDADGDSAERFLIRKPVPGARISSNYGMRTHPITGKYQAHKGVDFKAPMSARIYAAGDGVVEKIGRKGGYGRHVLIRHANGYKTAYAHMSGYSRQLYIGARVKQGDLVGFVGSTGHSTGPHLHYEVIHNGLHVDPMALQLPTGRKLAAKPAVMEQFETHRRGIDKVRRELGAGLEIASASQSGSYTTAHLSEAP